LTAGSLTAGEAVTRRQGANHGLLTDLAQVRANAAYVEEQKKFSGKLKEGEKRLRHAAKAGR